MSATKQLLERLQQTQAETQQTIDLCDGLATAWAIGGEYVDMFLDALEAGTPAARAACEIELAALASDYQAMTEEERAAIYPDADQRAARQEKGGTITTIITDYPKAA